MTVSETQRLRILEAENSKLPIEEQKIGFSALLVFERKALFNIF